MFKLSAILGAVGFAAAVSVATPSVTIAEGTEPGVANFLSAVNMIRDEMDQLKAEKSISPNDFRLANLQKFTNAGNAAVLARAIEKNSHDIHELREALGRNAIVVRTLAAAGISVEQVVALDVERGSVHTIYYQPAG